MRNKLLVIVTLLATLISPTATIAEPATQAKKTVDDATVVGSIKAETDSKVGLTQDEVAAQKIAENLKNIENEKKAEEAKKASEVSAPVIAVDSRTDFSALYTAAGARFGVSPAILAAVHYVETGQSGNTTRGSYAGAQGPMQFMPSTFAAYAVDGDGDGVANIFDVDDAIFSAAKYLAADGAASGNVVGALFCYNHSMAYVNQVLGIARGFGYNG